MKMRSVSQHAFSMVPRAEIPRSSFDRSSGYKTTFDAGLLIPIVVDEALPGDTFNLKMQGFARMATPIFPIMDNMYLDSFFFFVPMRLVWENWEKFCGAQDDPGDSTDYVIPTIDAPDTGFVTGTIADYFGLPVGVSGLGANGVNVSVLPFRAYNLIWNEWFRDENLQDSLVVSVLDSPTAEDNGLNSQPPLRRGKRHDYFTSCLPFPQKGDAVTLPLGTTAPVEGQDDVANPGFKHAPRFEYIQDAPQSLALRGVQTTGDVFTNPGPTVDGELLRWSSPRLVADLSAATAATINQLRQAFQVQRLLERDARGGTRYTEIVRAHFGVVSPDARLQRPEYLGGGSTPVNVVAIPQTSSTDATSPQGNLAAYATASLNGHGFVKSFTEHGIIIGMVAVRADLTYQQGINRMWNRSTRFDFFWPALSHIGEQTVLNKEIYAQATSADEAVFGYQERYAEYRYRPSQITGLLRSDPNPGTSLDAWHLAQEFTSLPVLDSDFIEDNPPLDRVIAVTNEPHFIFDSVISLRCARPMPLYGVPGMIDHF